MKNKECVDFGRDGHIWDSFVFVLLAIYGGAAFLG